jgi:hypothetical protein
MTDTIYYFPIDGEGNEQEPLAIVLSEDGKVDLSMLPKAMAELLAVAGIPGPGHLGQVYPTAGPIFLEALIAWAHPYARFRRLSTRV